jgi:hypothetical protein
MGGAERKIEGVPNKSKDGVFSSRNVHFAKETFP